MEGRQDIVEVYAAVRTAWPLDCVPTVIVILVALTPFTVVGDAVMVALNCAVRLAEM